MLANLAGADLPIFLLIAVVVIFGGSQLPKIARNVGSAGKEFRKAQREAEEEEAKKAESAPPAVTAGPVAQPNPMAQPNVVQTTPVAPAAPATPAGQDDKVTISKAELSALLDERGGKSESTGSTN